jgi:hypothetical protein
VPLLEGLVVIDDGARVEDQLPRLDGLLVGKLPPLEPLEAFGKPLTDGHDIEEPSPLAAAPNVDVRTVPEDIWDLSKNLSPIEDDIKFLTWQNFLTKKKAISIIYLSEAGPATFDAALQQHAAKAPKFRKAGQTIHNSTLLQSLWQLGIGRASVLFSYNEQNQRFEQAIGDGKASGTSLASCQSLIQDFLKLGNANRKLDIFVEKSYSARSAIPGQVALARMVTAVRDSIEARVVERGRNLQSLIQLQTLFERPKSLIDLVSDLVDAASGMRTDEALLSTIFSKAQEFEQIEDMQTLLGAILQLVGRPWLDGLQQSVGLTAKGPRTNAKSMNNDEIQVLPDFVQHEERTKIMETNGALEFLQENHPDHHLLISVDEKLEWAFNWNDLDRIAQKAVAYQENLRSALNQHSLTSTMGNISKAHAHEVDNTAWLAFNDPGELANSMEMLHHVPMESAYSTSDQLLQCVDTFLTSCMAPSDPLRPPLSLSFHLSTQSLLDIQHRELMTAALTSIIRHHDLRSHLNILHSFQFFTSGSFSARLSAALLSPEAELAERRKNKARSGGNNMGLKLGSGERREWPPASSELRLALMGILTDSWQAQSATITHREATTMQQSLPTAEIPTTTFTSGGRCKSVNNNLSNNLSFALRTDLAPADIDRILDPDSIYALDFLRLTYTPPQALCTIFTTSALDSYDRVFRLLLRLLRVNFVLGQIFRNTVVIQRGNSATRRSQRASGMDTIQRFRNSASHFMQTLTSIFIMAGIEKPWSTLMDYIGALDDYLDGNLSPRPRHEPFTLATLIAAHDTALETITASLLLRSRQRKAAVALEGVLGSILTFAKILREGTEERNDQVDRCFAQYRQHVNDFVIACRAGLDRKVSVASEGSRDDADECIREIVERLEEGLP